ncbi:MAG: AAA family ATPase [Minisyncoccia bacterium]
MRLKSLEISGFKSFARKTTLQFDASITAVVGPNGSGKSNVAESLRFALGEQSMKSMRGKRGEDLIWNGAGDSPRANRAAVKIAFDNADRAFNLDFDEVAIERAVGRDGSNDYLLNGSRVRLRDIAELLARAGVGASGHYIISQGEADRALSASPRERRAMMEDALGLTAYLYKREEAEKKLEKTAENMREVEGLRRELSPHLKFLSAQMRKIEESRALLQELQTHYLDYLAREHVYISETKKRLLAEREAPECERREVDTRIAELTRAVETKAGHDGDARHVAGLEQTLSGSRRERERLSRELGRIEGELAAANAVRETAGDVPRSRALLFAHDIIATLQEQEHANVSALKEMVRVVLSRAREFVASLGMETEKSAAETLQALKERKQTLERHLEATHAAEEAAMRDIHAARAALDKEKDAGRAAERELFAALSRRSELESALAAVAQRQSLLASDTALLEEQIRDAVMLAPEAARGFEQYSPLNDESEPIPVAEMLAETREAQRERLRRLERLKIRAEESLGSSASEIDREHAETRERDEFLAREHADLSASCEQLRTLIAEISETLDTRFQEGIGKVGEQFCAFFKLLFGGGDARLSLVAPGKTRGRSLAGSNEDDDEENDDVEAGIEVSISLPHKRVKGLHMLSGGERSLVSIALIFAMSQVNPPPFLILDETDAALDEANSRRYGDMLERLAHSSQLIVITHNRETMSRAGILYGITMGRDGISKLLSVKFEEAVAVAK